MLKVAITFWGTGPYYELYPDWVTAVEQYFLPGCERKIYVFTDNIPVQQGDIEIVHCPIPHYGFPESFNQTFVHYYNVFHGIASEYDWIIVLDADLIVRSTISSSDLFESHHDYIGVHHPCHYLRLKPHNRYPASFEDNSLSRAFFRKEEFNKSIYFQACLWGSRGNVFLDFVSTLLSYQQADLVNNITARFYEESYINRFFNSDLSKVSVLPPAYAYPESLKELVRLPNLITHIDKRSYKLKTF